MSAGHTPAGRAHQVSSVILQGRWLVLARAGWVGVALVALAVFIASIPTYVAQRQAVCTGRACAERLLTPETARVTADVGKKK